MKAVITTLMIIVALVTIAVAFDRIADENMRDQIIMDYVNENGILTELPDGHWYEIRVIHHFIGYDGDVIAFDTVYYGTIFPGENCEVYYRGT